MQQCRERGLGCEKRQNMGNKKLAFVIFFLPYVLLLDSCKKSGPVDNGDTSTVREVQWGTYQGNYQRTGQSLYVGSQEGKIEWVKDFGAIGTFAPVIDEDGTIYVGFENGKLYAIDKKDSILWVFNDDLILTAPSIGKNGILYFGSLSGVVYAVTKFGAKVWSINLNERMDCSGSVIDNDGNIYICTETKLHSISKEGVLLWSYPLGVQTFGAPALGHDGTIYVLSDKIYALSKKGDLLWTVNHSSQGTQWSSPSVGSDGTVYVHPKGDSLFAISQTGIIKWKFPTGVGGDVSNTPSISKEGIIYLAVGPLLYAIDLNGKQKFRKEIFGALLDSPPVVGNDGTIYFGADGGGIGKNFFALTKDGIEKFSLSLRDKFGTLALISVPPAISKDGKVYIVAYRHSFGLTKLG